MRTTWMKLQSALQLAQQCGLPSEGIARTGLLSLYSEFTTTQKVFLACLLYRPGTVWDGGWAPQVWNGSWCWAAGAGAQARAPDTLAGEDLM